MSPRTTPPSPRVPDEVLMFQEKATKQLNFAYLVLYYGVLDQAFELRDNALITSTEI